MKTYQPGNTRNTSAYPSEQMEIDPRSPGIIASSEQSQKGVKPDNNPYRDNLPLGSVDYVYMQDKEISLNKPRFIPNNKQQVLYSFFPAKYGNYTSMSIPQAQRFAKDFGSYIVLTYLIGLIAMCFINQKVNLFVTVYLLPIVMSYMSVKLVFEMLSGLLINIAIYMLLWPINHRFSSLILRQIAKLYLKISNRDVSPKNLYIISIYAIVPFKLLYVISLFMPTMSLFFIVLGVMAAVDVIGSILFICIATAYVD